jgi:hypothetical protein
VIYQEISFDHFRTISIPANVREADSRLLNPKHLLCSPFDKPVLPFTLLLRYLFLTAIKLGIDFIGKVRVTKGFKKVEVVNFFKTLC